MYRRLRCIARLQLYSHSCNAVSVCVCNLGQSSSSASSSASSLSEGLLCCSSNDTGMLVFVEVVWSESSVSVGKQRLFI